MGYSSGTLSFTRYRVVGEAFNGDMQDLLENVATHRFREHEGGVPDENSYGWVGPGHILDPDFTFENCVFGDFLIIGIRQDLCRVPAEVKRAYQLMEEKAAAAGNPSGFISKLQKREAKDAVDRKINDELRDGKHRKSKLTHVIWDLTDGVLYAPNGKGSQAIVSEIFERTFDLSLAQITPAHLGMRAMTEKGKASEFEDWKPTPFVSPDDVGVMWATYPWVARGDVQNFIGNEFLMLLLFQTVAGGDLVSGGRMVEVMFRESLDIDCAFGQSGRDSLKDACPANMPEALPALRTGKVPRKAGLILTQGSEAYSFTLTGDTFAITGLRLPDVEDAESLRQLTEERLMLLRGFSRAFDGLFNAFIDLRAKRWDDTASKIKSWLGGAVPRAAKAETSYTPREIQSIIRAGKINDKMLEIRDLVHRVYHDTYVNHYFTLRAMIREKMTKEDTSPLSAVLVLCREEKAKQTPQLTLFYIAAAVDMIQPKETTPAGEEKPVITREMAKAMKKAFSPGGGIGSVTMEVTTLEGKKESVTVDDSNRKQFNANCDAIIQEKAPAA